MAYGILYGAEGRGDYDLDVGYETADAACAAYDPDRRYRYMDGVIGGATVVELDHEGAPCETIMILAMDVCPTE